MSETAGDSVRGVLQSLVSGQVVAPVSRFDFAQLRKGKISLPISDGLTVEFNPSSQPSTFELTVYRADIERPAIFAFAYPTIDDSRIRAFEFDLKIEEIEAITESQTRRIAEHAKLIDSMPSYVGVDGQWRFQRDMNSMDRIYDGEESNIRMRTFDRQWGSERPEPEEIHVLDFLVLPTGECCAAKSLKVDVDMGMMFFPCRQLTIDEIIEPDVFQRILASLEISSAEERKHWKAALLLDLPIHTKVAISSKIQLLDL